MSNNTYCGFIAIVGRPNVGKSSLLNRILDHKVSITSKKPQTTRHQVMGIKTMGTHQIVFVDTPGIHASEGRLLNRYMNKAARAALQDVDAVVFVVEGLKWTDEDELVKNLLEKLKCPIYLAVNKVDTVEPRERLFPHLEALSKKLAFTEIIPVSAVKGTNLSVLEEKIKGILPPNPFYFMEGDKTNQSEGFSLAEIIREKLMRLLGDEIPYAVTVEIEKVEKTPTINHVHAVIWVERDGQKAIVIGEGGKRLKEIGQKARLDMEGMYQKKVFLKLWVKVSESWSDNARALKSLGYGDFE